MQENQIFELDPTTVKVRGDAPRYRQELGDIGQLVDSITRFGQLQPVVITRDNELVYGGRRLTACVLAGIPVKVCYKDVADTLLLRELELEENLQRKDFTPAESAIAIAEIHKLKQSIYGESTSGRKGGWGLEKTGELIGKTKGAVADALEVAAILKDFPELSSAKTTSDIKKAYKGMERIQKSMAALAVAEEMLQRSDEFVLVNKNAVEYMKGIGSESVDLFLTDPPYGINVHEIAITTGGDTGGNITGTGVKYEDSEDYAKELLSVVAKESYRIVKDNGHAYIFCAPSHFWWLKEQMNAAGWITRERPIVWIKQESGQNNQPDYWPSSAYEFILFARKTNSRLVIPGRPDWIQCNIVTSSERIHQAEKPVPLLKELISRTTMPSEILLDPFMGSGAIVQAACEMKLRALGCELDTQIYSLAVNRIKTWKEKSK